MMSNHPTTTPDGTPIVPVDGSGDRCSDCDTVLTVYDMGDRCGRCEQWREHVANLGV